MKCSLTFLLIFFSTCILFSQKKSVGFSAGMSQANLLFDHGLELNEEWRRLYDLAVVINFTYEFDQRNAIRAELAHEFKGSYFKHIYQYVDGQKYGPSSFSALFQPIGSSSSTGTRWYENKFRYVSIPVLYQYNLDRKGNYYFHIGPSVGYLVDHKDNYHYRFPEGFTRWDFSAIAGIGTCLPLRDRIAIQINARTAYGLNSIKKDGDVTLKHLTFSGLVGFQYLLD
ncbi:MAG: outer membrane beta-barrel protein [Bacteroidota bacterium]